MRITRFPTLNEVQFQGCNSAFVDALFAVLGSSVQHLRKLEGQPKGAAFAFEMQLDQDRYGALIILERWADLVNAFRDHLHLSVSQSILDDAPARVQTAENILGQLNSVIDATSHYHPEIIAACSMAAESLQLTFAEERKLAERMSALGPMLPEEFLESRRLFAADLAAR